ncbi:formimidoyltransferase-cyclodeaminase-like isoform X2 [Uloborus diversus]|nr:formimidoyltransferase-cyclodeaminase-like isoform X2 [Uloborus diversus]XP_054722326.1 formimidoyltransferase-cyclodeaminase-like isoform X2 [Uloborus diversus]
MVGQMTYGKRQWERYDSQMRRIIPIMYDTMKELMNLIDADTSAFNDYMAALKLPKETPEDLAMRGTAMEAGLKKAITVPMSLAKYVSKLWEPLKELAAVGNFGTKSDLQVGIRCLETGVLGAYYNVTINAEGIKDEKYKNGVLNEIEQYRLLADRGCQEALQILQERRA